MQNSAVIRLFLFSIMAFILTACGERSADVENSQRYDKDGLSFNYPGNWSVTEDIGEYGFRYLFIESPGDAILRVQIYSKEDSLELIEFVEFDIENLKAEMPEFLKIQDKEKIAPSIQTIEGKVFKGYKYDFNLSILGIDVPHATQYYSLEFQAESAYLVSQVAADDLSKVDNGFKQILGSLDLKEALSGAAN